MDSVLLHPCYFGPVSQFVAMAAAKSVVFEDQDNFQKQTYRNRMYIYGANGKLSLTIPIKHTGNKSQHQKYRDVRIENDFPWQNQHWKSLETVYRTSPFFEFYEEDFRPLYTKQYDFLMDFNYACTGLALDCLDLEVPQAKTTEFIMDPPGDEKDLRSLVNAKAPHSFEFEPYHQVFQARYGHLTDLSIIDLIFNEGPAALQFLENQEL